MLLQDDSDLAEEAEPAGQQAQQAQQGQQLKEGQQEAETATKWPPAPGAATPLAATAITCAYAGLSLLQGLVVRLRKGSYVLREIDSMAAGGKLSFKHDALRCVPAAVSGTAGEPTAEELGELEQLHHQPGSGAQPWTALQVATLRWQWRLIDAWVPRLQTDPATGAAWLHPDALAQLAAELADPGPPRGYLKNVRLAAQLAAPAAAVKQAACLGINSAATVAFTTDFETPAAAAAVGGGAHAATNNDATSRLQAVQPAALPPVRSPREDLQAFAAAALAEAAARAQLGTPAARPQPAASISPAVFSPKPVEELAQQAQQAQQTQQPTTTWRGTLCLEGLGDGGGLFVPASGRWMHVDCQDARSRLLPPVCRLDLGDASEAGPAEVAGAVRRWARAAHAGGPCCMLHPAGASRWEQPDGDAAVAFETAMEVMQAKSSGHLVAAQSLAGAAAHEQEPPLLLLAPLTLVQAQLEEQQQPELLEWLQQHAGGAEEDAPPLVVLALRAEAQPQQPSTAHQFPAAAEQPQAAASPLQRRQLAEQHQRRPEQVQGRKHPPARAEPTASGSPAALQAGRRKRAPSGSRQAEGTDGGDRGRQGCRDPGRRMERSPSKRRRLDCPRSRSRSRSRGRGRQRHGPQASRSRSRGRSRGTGRRSTRRRLGGQASRSRDRSRGRSCSRGTGSLSRGSNSRSRSSSGGSSRSRSQSSGGSSLEDDCCVSSRLARKQAAFKGILAGSCQ
ncbi:hypothetical protein ABPG75_009672 [Micractinium tetrahymenae]